jgi:hypothetical protein
MNEDDLRQALVVTKAAVTPPPPMSSAAVLAGARRARLRRILGWTSAGSVLSLTVIAVVATVLSGSLLPGGLDVGSALFGPDPNDTKAVWPTGPDGQPQQDRTASAGARYDQGVRLLEAVIGALPAGLSAPSNDSTAQDQPNRYHQAQFEERNGAVEVWEYLASVAAVSAAGGVGQVTVTVHTSSNRLPSAPCPLALTFWGMTGTCQVLTVGTARVGVVTSNGDRGFDSWAAFRHADGVVVIVGQGRSRGGGAPALAEAPFTLEKLAALATSTGLHLT